MSKACAPVRTVCLVLCAAALVIASGCQSSGDDGTVSFRSTEWRTGRAVTIEDFRGRPVLMSSWATWCEPCKRELPELQEFYVDHRAEGLEVVAVNVNVSGPSESKIDPMIQQFALSMPIWRDANDDFTMTFGGLGVPMTVLIGADGTLLHKWQGEIDTSDREFQAAVNAAIQESASS